MSAAAHPHALFEDALTELGLGDEADQLRDELTTTPEKRGIRAAVLDGFVKQLDPHPDKRAAYDAFARRFPRLGPFSMEPYGVFALKLTRVGTLYAPDLPWIEAANAVVEQAAAVDYLETNPILRPMLEACDRDMAEFLRVMVTGCKALMNVADLELETCGRRHYRLHFDTPCPRVMIRGFPGGFRGTMRFLECDGEVTVVDADEANRHLELEMRWTPA